MLTKKSKKIFALILLPLLLLSNCGRETESETSGLPSRDGDVGWLRKEFKKGALIKDVNTLRLNKYWICKQRSAIKNSNHSGRFWQYFKMRGMEVVNDTTFFLDQRETMIGLFGVGQRGTSGSYSALKTDRYSLPYANNTAFSSIRKMANGSLIVEWTMPRCTTVSGRDLSVVLPELGPNCLGEPSVSDPKRDSFLYAVCEPEKPLQTTVYKEFSTCKNETGMCKLISVVLTNHSPLKPSNSYSQNSALVAGGVQYSYGENLVVSEGTCTREVEVPVAVFKGVANAMKLSEKGVTLAPAQKAFLELFLGLQKKVQNATCTW